MKKLFLLFIVVLVTTSVNAKSFYSQKIVSCSAGAFHTLAIDESGNLWAWGENSASQSGDDSSVYKSNPMQIKSGKKFKTISAGFSHSMAIDELGNLWVWGSDEYGKPGNGTLIATQFYIPPPFWSLY